MLVKKSSIIFDSINSKKGQVAVLIDPEKSDNKDILKSLLEKAKFAGINYLFIGGSTVS